MCRFNLSAQELRAVVLEPWSQERWIEFGERKWSPHQATLTVIEGPHIPFGQLTMGRGWRTAERQGREVTEALLAAIAREPTPSSATAAPADAAGARRLAREGASGVAGEGASGVPGEGGSGAAGEGAAHAGTSAGRSDAADEAARADGDALAADSLGLELLSHLGSERAPLRRAWELAGERHPGSPPSATLALAERAVESLLRRQLIVLSRGEEAAGEAGQARALDEREVSQALGAFASWADGEVVGGTWMRRA
jgi:hypothetical protein